MNLERRLSLLQDEYAHGSFGKHCTANYCVKERDRRATLPIGEGPALIKELREKTGAGIMDCKRALGESGNSVDQAIKLLREKGLAAAQRREGRSAKEGTIASYIHLGGRLGVLLEARCETDFVARTDVFKTLVKDLGMHIAAAGPRYLERADVPESILESERDVYLAQVKELGKPESATKKIVEGKIEKFYADICLLEQPFVKDQKKTIKEILLEASAQLGEKVTIQRFVLYRLGDS